jgi:type IV pilus assembly protein PilX
VLIVALAMLLMLTLLSVGMFRSLGLEERITGNTREKQHAFYAAQSALLYGENWLNQGNAGLPVTCAGTTATPQVCSQASTPAQAALATQAWNTTFGTSYVPPTAIAQNTIAQYYASPQFGITYLGPDPAKPGAYLYQVTSQGYGGNSNAVAVVQSVWSVGSGGSCISCAH